MPATCTDDEFIRVWNHERSATRVAEVLKLSLQAVHRRRRSIELRHAIQLGCDHWNSPDFNVVLPENGVRVHVSLPNGVIIVGSDAHYWPGVVSTAHRAMVQAVKNLKPNMVIMNGDVLDGATISKHERIQWEVRPTVKQELEAASDRLAEIEAVAGKAKLHWTWGNHDTRFNSRLSHHAAAYEGVTGFNLADHFLRWKFSMSVMVNENCVIKHRWHNGIHATWNNVLKSGTSMITGHLHALQVRPYTDYNGTRYAVDTGTLARPEGKQFVYAEDSPANHRSGLAVLTFYQGKLLPPELIEVVDEDAGTVFFRGQVFTP